jgi:predicted PurR-regulated permease PerM
MTVQHYPFYLKCTIILFGLVLLGYILNNLGEILIPLAFALMLAILLNPLMDWLERKGVPQLWAITICLLVAIIVLGGIGYFLISQIIGFSDELPLLQRKSQELIGQFKDSIHTRFGVSVQKEEEFLREVQTKLKPLLGRTLGSMLGVIAILILIPIYLFLFLFYKTLILNFIHETFQKDHSKEVDAILNQTKGAIQNYMVV